MFKVFLLLLISAFSVAQAELSPPTLFLNTQAKQLDLSWSVDSEALGYTLLYAPFPYQGSETIGRIDMENSSAFSIELPEGASYYVAIQAYSESE